MTFDDLEHCVNEEVIMEYDVPAVITAEISTLLNGLNPEDVFVVNRLAKDIAAVIARELAFKDGDMVDVVQRLGAILEPMINWLKRHGVKAHSLRSTKPTALC
jgi:hypothetical protein